MRVIEVNKCSECPYKALRIGVCSKTWESIHDDEYDIPDWCPLTKAEDMEVTA